jgi:hypothetical protein
MLFGIGILLSEEPLSVSFLRLAAREVIKGSARKLGQTRLSDHFLLCLLLRLLYPPARQT